MSRLEGPHTLSCLGFWKRLGYGLNLSRGRTPRPHFSKVFGDSGKAQEEQVM